MANRLQDTTEVSRFTASEERAILAVTCLAAFLFFNSFGSIGVALPMIQKQFGNSLAEIQWIALMGVVTISSLSFCFGRAGSILGQRQLYKFGVALGGETGCEYRGRHGQGHRRGHVLGLFASAIAIGRMTGPAIGGFLLQFGGWPWIFWMNFIVGAAVTAAVIKIFRGTGHRQPEAFDIWGSVALLIGYPALLIGLTFGTKLGWSSAPVAGCFLVAAIGLASFVWIELHSARPLVDLRLFKRKMLAAALAAVVLSHVIYNPIALCAPLYLQNVLGASALLAGLILAVLPLSTALASPLSGRLADRYDAPAIGAIGMAIIVAGIACYAGLGIGTPLSLVVAVLFLLGAGIGFFTPANQKAAFATIEREDYGVLAAMLSSFGTAAGTIGTTITVALMEIAGGGELWTQPAAFAGAQRFAFACLVPIGLLAVWIASKRGAGHPAADAASS